MAPVNITTESKIYYPILIHFIMFYLQSNNFNFKIRIFVSTSL